MTAVSVSASTPTDADVIVFATEDSPRPDGVSEAEFSGKKGSSVLIRSNGRRILHCGLGKSDKVKEDTLRQATGAGVRKLLKIGASKAAVELGSHAERASAIVEGALLGGYVFEEFKMEDARRKNHLESLVVVAPDEGGISALEEAATAGQAVADSVNLVRTLGNRPGNFIYPETLADEARKVADENGLELKVWDEKALKEEGFGGILAVGQGSAHKPRMIQLAYNGGAEGEAPVVFVGKAITFDSGGISLKPGAQMDEMKFDKMGGCAVLGIVQAAAQLKLPLNVVGVIAAAENMPDGEAYRPGDIVTTYNGMTIEVLNTDAEGRIVLADALAYSAKHLKPREMYDLATLTGACVIALGHERAALYNKSFEKQAALKEIGERTGDRVWPMPMGEEYTEMMKSDIAHVKNIGGGRAGGSCSAASFLQHWAGDTDWTHLDIAGTGWTTKDTPHQEKGATGFGVRLLTQYLKELSNKK